MSAPPEDCLSWQRLWGEALVGGLLEALWGIRVAGRGNVPPSGPLIVACNHVSLLDPNTLAWALHEVRRPRFLGKKELFENPALRRLFLSLGGIPLDRKGSDVAAMRAAVSVLEAGGSMIIFPEGTRVRPGQARPPKPGVAFLASAGRAPVLPARVLGTDRFPWVRPLEVRFGKALPPPAPGREAAKEFARAVMDAVYAL